MGKLIPSYKLELDDAPNWLSHIEISQEGETIHFEVIRTNGSSCGEARLSLIDFNNMADVLTTIRGESS